MLLKFQENLRSFGVTKDLESEILEEALLKKHNFYLFLAEYLSPLYPSIPADKLKELSFAAYLYFRFLINLDQLLDNNDPQNKIIFFSSIRIFEYSLQTLAYLFPKESSFWHEFEEYKKQYAKTVLQEKEFSKNNIKITQELFYKLAIGKSAICYTFVSALNHLEGTKAKNEEIVDCLKQIHIAFQYIDDLDDFKKDLSSGQKTYAHELVNQKIVENGYGFSEEPELKYKYLFVSGIASNLIAEAIMHFTLSLKIAGSMGLKKLEEYITNEITQCNARKTEIDQLLDKTYKKTTKSNNYIVNNPSLNIIELATNSIKLSNDFLLKNLNDNGLWSDFLTTAGEGQTWVSAYTGMMMAEIGMNIPFLENLLKKHSINGSFNETIIQDCDSTNFLVGFNKLLNQNDDTGLDSEWCSYMNPNGGWVTYRNEKALRERLQLNNNDNVCGWLSEHLCVTSAAAYVLFITKLHPDKLSKTREFLASNIEKDFYWMPYWWTSPVYPTSFAIIALSGDDSFHDITLKACKKLICNQSEDGFWINPPYNIPSAFYTALALKALICISPDEFKGNILSGINWLIKNQTTDGSWQTNRVLCIPSPETKKLSDVRSWRNSSFGTNIIVDDHNRIFTTATVLNVLKIFLNNSN